MKLAQYIVIEGCEGVGKSTQCGLLVKHLQNLGYKVMASKEPGTLHAPLTVELRNIMLDAKYDKQLTTSAREFISQAIRSIHLEHVIVPALNEYDYIVQDRGILSGLAYGEACGNDIEFLINLITPITSNAGFNQGVSIYDKVILLTGNVKAGLDKAVSSKKEFETGDAIEMKGSSFMEKVNDNMTKYSHWFNTASINVDNKSINNVFEDIVSALGIRK